MGGVLWNGISAGCVEILGSNFRELWTCGDFDFLAVLWVRDAGAPVFDLFCSLIVVLSVGVGMVWARGVTS